MRLGNIKQKENYTGPPIPYDEDHDQTSTLFIGQPQTGKTTLLCNSALEDICNLEKQKSVAFIDFKGTGFDALLLRIPKEREQDVIVVDASDTDYCFCLNILATVQKRDHAVFVSTLLSSLKDYWLLGETPTANINQFFKAAIGSLLNMDHVNLFHVQQLLLYETMRDKVRQPNIPANYRWFWTVFEQGIKPENKHTETSSTKNKFWDAIFEPVIGNLIGARDNHLKFKDKIVLVKLPVLEIGVDNAKFLAALILTQLQMDAREENIEVYIDDCQYIGPIMLERLLTTLPGLGCSIVTSLSFLDQLQSGRYINSILGSARNLFTFRCSPKDASLLEQIYDMPKDTGHTKFTSYPDWEVLVSFAMSVETNPLPPVEGEEIRKNILHLNRKERCKPWSFAENRFTKFCLQAMDLTNLSKIVRVRKK